MNTGIKPIFEPFPFKEIAGIKPYELRVLLFDPQAIYENHPVDSYSRAQTKLSFQQIFPQAEDKVCSCGCGRALTGRKRRWATEECSAFALNVWRIIDGQADTIKYFINLYYKGTRRCNNCNRGRLKLELDHKIPVHAGGGGCWLNNYQRLCIECHKQKTKTDLRNRRAVS